MSTNKQIAMWLAIGLGVTALIGAPAIIEHYSESRNPQASAPSPSPKKGICDKSAPKQTGRRQSIDEMINKLHVFSKVEKPGEVVHVWVSLPFYATKFENKEALMQLVYCFYYDDDQSLIRIFDDRTGKQVGRYSVGLGLEMD